MTRSSSRLMACSHDSGQRLRRNAAWLQALSRVGGIMAEAVEVVRQFYAFLASGDVPGALALLHPEVQWTEATRSPYYAGTLCGVDEVVSKVLQPITADFGAFATTPTDFIAQGNRVVSFGNYTGVAKSTARALNAPFVHLWTVLDRRLLRFVQYSDSA